MKHITFLILAILFTQLSLAQTMTVHKNDQTTATFQLSQIDSITFSLAPENVIYYDDFESYPLDSFPSGWVSSGGQNQITISNSAYHSPSKSLKTSGIGGNAGGYRSIATFPDTTFIQLWVKTPANLTSLDTGSVAFGIRYYLAINFVAKDSSIRLSDYYTGTGPGTIFGHFQPGSWHKMKVEFHKNSNTVSCWVNDVLMIQDAPISPYATGTLDFNFGIANLQKEFYLDDLTIW
jgi:hypothetical protein